MNTTRPSILSRPLHQNSRSHEETAERQAEKERLQLELKRLKYQQTEEMLRLSRQPHPSREQCDTLLKAQAEQLHRKESRIAVLQDDERKIAALQTELVVHEQQTEAARQEARRQLNRLAMEENLRLAAEKAARAKQQREREIELENANLALQLRSQPSYR